MFAAVQACHAEVDYDVWDDIPPRLLVLAWFCCWPHSCNRNCLCCCTPHATNCQYYVNCAVFFLTTPLSYQGTQIIPQVLPYRVWIHRLPQKRWSKVNSETPVYNQTPSIISGCLFNLFCLFSPIGGCLIPMVFTIPAHARRQVARPLPSRLGDGLQHLFGVLTAVAGGQATTLVDFQHLWQDPEPWPALAMGPWPCELGRCLGRWWTHIWKQM